MFSFPIKEQADHHSQICTHAYLEQSLSPCSPMSPQKWCCSTVGKRSECYLPPVKWWTPCAAGDTLHGRIGKMLMCEIFQDSLNCIACLYITDDAYGCVNIRSNLMRVCSYCKRPKTWLPSSSNLLFTDNPFRWVTNVAKAVVTYKRQGVTGAISQLP